MKFQTLPTKRRPVSKGVFRKLSAVTTGRRRKQRAATTASARDFDEGQGSARIGRALFVILLIHVLAVAMIFVHHRFLSKRPAEPSVAEVQTHQAVPNAVSQPRQEAGVVRAELTAQQRGYMTVQGDTYASIAAAHQVAEQDLRALNDNVEMRPGRNLKIPVKRVVIRATRPADAPPIAATPQAPPAPAVPARDQGLVEAVDTRNAPRAAVVNATATDGTYVVQKGDSIWRIANRHGVDQQKLMDLNGISDPRKLQAGMTLRIP